jgi:hypothetical protein
VVIVRLDKIRNTITRKKVKVALIVKKMVKSHLRWFDHVGEKIHKAQQGELIQ